MNKNKKILIGVALLVVVFILFIIAYIKTSNSIDERKKNNAINQDLVKNIDDDKKKSSDIKEVQSEKKKDYNRDNNKKEEANANKQSNEAKENTNQVEKKDKVIEHKQSIVKTDNNNTVGNKEDKKEENTVEKDEKDRKEEKPSVGSHENHTVTENRTDYQINPRLGEIVDGWYVWPSLFDTEKSAKSFGDDYLSNVKYIEIDSKKYYFNEYKYDVLRYKDNTVAGTRIQFKLIGNE